MVFFSFPLRLKWYCCRFFPLQAQQTRALRALPALTVPDPPPCPWPRTPSQPLGLPPPCPRPRTPPQPPGAISPFPSDATAGLLSSPPQPCPARPWAPRGRSHPWAPVPGRCPTPGAGAAPVGAPQIPCSWLGLGRAPEPGRALTEPWAPEAPSSCGPLTLYARIIKTSMALLIYVFKK